jgi:hypothetical protein
VSRLERGAKFRELPRGPKRKSGKRNAKERRRRIRDLKLLEEDLRRGIPERVGPVELVSSLPDFFGSQPGKHRSLHAVSCVILAVFRTPVKHS